MRCLVKFPGKPFTINELTDELRTFQSIVGGHIEVVPINSRTIVICNEEGLIRDMEPNIRLSVIGMAEVVIFGPAIICGVDGPEFADLPKDFDYYRYLVEEYEYD